MTTYKTLSQRPCPPALLSMTDLSFPPLLETTTAEDVPVTPAYQATLKIVQQSGYQDKYRDHSHFDRAALAHNPEKFIWILGERATYLNLYNTPSTKEILRYHAYKQSKYAVKIFIYQGGLREASAEEALAFTSQLPTGYDVTRHQDNRGVAIAYSLKPDLGEQLPLPFELGAQLYARQQETEARHKVRTNAPERTYWDTRETHAFQQFLRTLVQQLGLRKPSF